MNATIKISAPANSLPEDTTALTELVQTSPDIQAVIKKVINDSKLLKENKTIAGGNNQNQLGGLARKSKKSMKKKSLKKKSLRRRR
jgi:hypothetical protein